MTADATDGQTTTSQGAGRTLYLECDGGISGDMAV